MNGRLTITEVAKAVGVTPRTIMRWEKAGKVKKPKRDWRGWRFYYKEDLEEIKRFYETCYEYDEANGVMMNISNGVIALLMISFLCIFSFCGLAYAGPNVTQGGAITETKAAVSIDLNKLAVVQSPETMISDPIKYTLGPNDIIEIEVRRHPEFSSQCTINSEGKIEYKFVGDIIVDGLTKAQLKERLTKILSKFIIEPEVDVSIVAYLSKVFYVVGDVLRPGKFYMRGNTVTVREAVIQAGLPTQAAALKKCRLITPNDTGEDNYVEVNLQELLYEGDLTANLEMKPGDVFYVPPTVMAKIIRVISPVTNLTGQASGIARRGMAIAP